MKKIREQRESKQRQQEDEAKTPERNLTKQRLSISPVSQILEGQSSRDPYIPSGVDSYQTGESWLKKKGKKAREVHKQQERQQRNKLPLAFDALRVQLLGVVTARKVSKQQILDQAAEMYHSVPKWVFFKRPWSFKRPFWSKGLFLVFFLI